jgi:hypothetical protein
MKRKLPSSLAAALLGGAVMLGTVGCPDDDNDVRIDAAADVPTDVPHDVPTVPDDVGLGVDADVDGGVMENGTGHPGGNGVF